MSFVTCAHKEKAIYKETARKLAKILEWPFVDRAGASVQSLCEQYHVSSFLMVGANGPVLCNREGTMHKFHLSMAHLRFLRIDRNEKDHFVEAILALGKSHMVDRPLRVLDATLGLGADSLVLAYALQQKVSITGIEGCRPLAYITNYGYRHFQGHTEKVNRALRSIQVYAISHGEFLAQCPANAYDIVYFDPMFERPIVESPQFTPLRTHILETPLQNDVVKEATRVARLGILVKERPQSQLFRRLGITEFHGGKYSRICYGIYRK